MGAPDEDVYKRQIEVVYPFEDNVGLIVNEEGKINGLPLNRALRDEKGEIYDVIADVYKRQDPEDKGSEADSRTRHP